MYPYNNPSMIEKGLAYLKTIKWSSLLDGTQKTLGVINQAIPIVYQIKPILSNTKTLLKTANALKQTPSTPKKEETSSTSPIFYL